VWVVDPECRLARVYREDGTEDMLDEIDQLLGADVLPGFSCTLASILGRTQRCVLSARVPLGSAGGVCDRFA